MTYDRACLQLAAHFLPSDCPEVKRLAQYPQDTVEDWLSLEQTLNTQPAGRGSEGWRERNGD
jgi:hypothetical protein